MLTINLEDMNKEEASLLGEYLKATANKAFYAKKDFHGKTGAYFKINHNLLREDSLEIDSLSLCGEKITASFCVISNLTQDSLGMGSSSRVRNIIGMIHLDTLQKASYVPLSGWAVRIKNINRCQQSRHTSKPYATTEAEKDYKKILHFPHLMMKKPLHVLKKSPKRGLFNFYKSYSVIAVCKEMTLLEFLNKNNDLKEGALIKLSLAILNAYREQVYKQKYVHCDIKPENIMLEEVNDNYIINIIDFDSSRAFNKKDRRHGTPIYAAPEAMGREKLPLTPARDIYSLGIILLYIWNRLIDPCSFPYTHKNLGSFYRSILNVTHYEGSSYDLFAYTKNSRYRPTAARNFSSTRSEHLDKAMTNMTKYKAEKRISLEEVIHEFTLAQEEWSPSPKL